jgi:hypothetical protein
LIKYLDRAISWLDSVAGRRRRVTQCLIMMDMSVASTDVCISVATTRLKRISLPKANSRYDTYTSYIRLGSDFTKFWMYLCTLQRMILFLPSTKLAF